MRGRYKKRDFKQKFNSVLNHPLTPWEFEAAWNNLIAEFKLEENTALQSLYDQCKRYIPVYFKGDYCGRMASPSTIRVAKLNIYIFFAFIVEI